jgi:hypothetical protein
MSTESGDKGGSLARDKRAERLGEALRQNLRRRKDAMRGDGSASDAPGDTANDRRIPPKPPGAR